MEEPYIALQVLMMPRDANTNPTIVPDIGPSPLYATIFGGVILSHIDVAGAIAAKREVLRKGGREDLLFVTVAINRVEFKQPVLVGDLVRFQTHLVKIGKTSITIHIEVIAQRNLKELRVTEAEVVYVGLQLVNGERKPAALIPGQDQSL